MFGLSGDSNITKLLSSLFVSEVLTTQNVLQVLFNPVTLFPTTCISLSLFLSLCVLFRVCCQ